MSAPRRRLRGLATASGLALGAALGACAGADQTMESMRPIAGAAGVGGLLDSAQKGLKATGLVAKSVAQFDPEQEYYIGRSVSAEVLANPQLDRTQNAALQDYVSRVGQAVALGAPSVRVPYQGFRFVVLASPTVNALAAPGGYVFVTEGAVSAAQSEEELAGVLAHEIAHVHLQHGLGAIRQSNMTEAMKLLGSEVAGSLPLSQVFGSSVQDIVATTINKGYSRDQELEADKLGAQFVAEAGYAPDGLVAYLRRNDFDTGGFKSDHPSASERVESLEAAIGAAAPPAGVDVRTARFRKAVGGKG